MSYQVLARRYRPQRFSDVVGQAPITVTLQNALKLGRLHHAYLFTGSRGVGKTSVARILAKALNCEKGPAPEPCNQCPLCNDITEGRSLAVQEIDGASNTSVDDVRQIRDQLKYLAAQGRYKIYIIDEVHMLSTSAFNALLKTLEEPPPHVIFIFATTDPQKIPATILSRCQRYDFRRIPHPLIAESLQAIAKEEKISITLEAVALIAKEAQGSLRDAQSLIDQAVAFQGSEISVEALQKMLGFTDRADLYMLVEAVISGKSREALDAFGRFYERGADLNRLALDLLETFRSLIILKTVGEVPSWLPLTDAELKTLQSWVGLRGLPEWDQYFHLLYHGVEDLARSPTPKEFFEVLLVRLTQIEKIEDIRDLIDKLEALQSGFSVTPEIAPQAPSKIEAEHRVAQKKENRWPDFVKWVQEKRPQMASILGHTEHVAEASDAIELHYKAGSVYAEMLEEKERHVQLEALVNQFFGRPLSVRVKFVSESEKMASTEASIVPAEERKKTLKEKALKSEALKEVTQILGAEIEEIKTL